MRRNERRGDRLGDEESMKKVLATDANFRALSLKDLLEARDLYHYHLMNKPNVVGTAIGLYLIRKNDPRPKGPSDSGAHRHETSETTEQPRPVRTLGNSEVRDYSWPCVLVFVRKWVHERDVHAGSTELHPTEMVPKTLYLPDGRMVPVCVVMAEPGSADDQQRIPDWHWPKTLFAPGMPIVVEAQGADRRATVGALVTDGHTTYALTNRHVAGNTGEVVYTLARGQRVPIGRASRRCISRVPFEKVYPEFPSRRTFVNMDVGLIALDRVADWTSTVLGLGPTEGLADLNQLNITTRLIDAPLVAAGAASGRMVGRIKALFYRYKSVGGYDYIADFLIAPQQDPDADVHDEVTLVQTQRGDSGTVWHLVTERETTDSAAEAEQRNEFDGDLRPLAMEWGGQVLTQNESGERFTFALATSLTTVCRSLDVELLTHQHRGAEPFWGQTGHYTIATFAIGELPNGKLKEFLQANVDRISFDTTDLTPKAIVARLKEAREQEAKDGTGFVPLADVPDIVWKKFKTHSGGRDTQVIPPGRTTGPEHPTHFADIDEPSDGSDATKTLRALSLADPKNNLTVEFWQQFYTALGHTTFDKRGLLPFRVWQFFDAMKGFAEERDPVGFLCAAGIVAHYVGDACQPLHGSTLADGFEDGSGKGVHSTYESAMIDRKQKFIAPGLAARANSGAPLARVEKGQASAHEVVKLMDRTADTIDPEAIVRAFIKAGGTKVVAVQDALWKQFGDRTIDVMADGGRTLAAIWQGAWDAGGGDAIANTKLGPADTGALSELYEDTKFVESLVLDDIGPVLEP